MSIFWITGLVMLWAAVLFLGFLLLGTLRSLGLLSWRLEQLEADRQTLPWVVEGMLGGDPGRTSALPLARLRYAIVWNKPVRRLLYIVDVVLFLAYRFYAEKVRNQVLIMDRYFYDTLIDVADGHAWMWARLLKRLTPTPDVPVLLDVTPEESFARKGEYSIEYLRHRWTGYQTVFPWVRSSVIVANHDLDVTKRILTRAVLERLAS